MFAQPCACETPNSTLFVGPHSFGGTTPTGRRPRFDLDEGNGVPSSNDEIEFTATAAPVLIENHPSPLFVPSSSQLLALPAKFLSSMCHESDSTDGL